MIKQDQDRHDLPKRVVGKICRQFAYPFDSKEKTMPSRMWTFLIVAMVAICMMPVASASATNGHQDHRGACARSTTSISKGVSDLAFNGVATSFAKSVGISGVNGSVTKQLKNQLTVGVVVHSVTTRNEGCDGHGHTFGAGHRTLFKGEKVIVKVPAKFGKDVCVHSHRNCHAVTFTVHVVFPGSCWNRNHGTITVKIWVKNQTTTKPATKCNSCTAPPSVTIICGNYAADNASTVSQGGNCNTDEENCVQNGGNWDSQTNICSSPPCQQNCTPTCQQNCTPPCQQNCTPPKKPQVSCVFPPHIYVNDSQFMYCEASGGDGSPISLNVVGDSHLQASSTIPVNYRWDNSPCPSGVTCFRTTLWGKSAGTATVTATASANGVSSDPVSGQVEVKDTSGPGSGF